MNQTDVSKNLAFLARRVGALEKKVQQLEDNFTQKSDQVDADLKYVKETLANGRQMFHDQPEYTHKMIARIVRILENSKCSICTND